MPLPELLNSIATQTNHQSASFSFSTVSVTNFVALAVGAFLLFYYVVSANGLAAAQYSVSSLRSEVAAATVEQTDLAIQSQNMADSQSVVVFAAAHGMVPAKDVAYVSENDSVALVR